MMLVERTTIPVEVLPVADFRSHLRLGTGFSDDGAEDGLLETFLRAAVSAVEAWTGKVMITRDYTWTIDYWRENRVQPLPVAPVTTVSALRQVDRDAVVTALEPDRYRLRRDLHRPLIESTGSLLPSVPVGGWIEIDFTAGFGNAWSDVPPALAHAVVLLAAHYHEYRAELRAGTPTIPYGVSVLAEPWRTMRLFGGGTR